MAKNDGGPAFPKATTFNPHWGDHGRLEVAEGGMSMRQAYAMKAMGAMLSNAHHLDNNLVAEIARASFFMADAMLLEEVR